MDLTKHLVTAEPDSRSDDIGRLMCFLLSGRHTVTNCLLDVDLLTSKYLTLEYISAVAFALFVSITVNNAVVLIIVHFYAFNSIKESRRGFAIILYSTLTIKIDCGVSDALLFDKRVSPNEDSRRRGHTRDRPPSERGT
jgi:hypothetical protein